MNYLYFPGCSLKCTGRHYEESLLAVFKALDITLTELDDWNCCGATAYMAIDEEKAFALAARNLAIAEEQGDAQRQGPAQVLAPCSACYLVLSKAQHYMEEKPELGRLIRTALKSAQMDYTGRVVVRHPLDVLVNDYGLDKVTAHVNKPLKGLKVACYYGCQVVRPYATFDDQHNPMTMDQLLQALGAETIDWPLKTRCCGGSLTGTIQDVGVRLNYILLREAKRRGANVIATACPLCQFNLECFQDKMDADVSLPTAYFTQLMGLAYGIPGQQLGLQRLFVPLGKELAGV
ncbi:MAG TPA: CoB--CoM heterodisulfide reductase iron-sulfur subunit B family protein [Armatimonadota bacterium]|jgi:heterodisulfide reductase subunit B